MPVTGSGIVSNGFSFFFGNFGRILAVAAVPILIILATNIASAYIQGQAVAEAARQGLAAPGLSPVEIALAVISIIASLWFAATIYRLRVSYEAPVQSSMIDAVFWLVLYNILLLLIIGIPFLIAAAAIVALFVVLCNGDILVLISPLASPNLNPLAVIVTIVLTLALFAALMYVSIRFNLGLPGVAIGRRPHLFRKIWPLGREVAWPIFWWGILIALCAIVLLLLVSGVIGALAGAAALQGADQASAPDPQTLAQIQLYASVFSAIWSIILSGLFASIYGEGYVQLVKAKPHLA